MAEETKVQEPGTTDSTGVVNPAQARTNTIARSLMGDAFVEQFGDVIGARPVSWTDRIRDFTIGFNQGFEGLQGLRKRVRDEYQRRHFRQQQLAVQQAVADRQKAVTIANIVQNAVKLPPKARKPYMKEAFGQLGLEPSNTMMTMLDDMDFVKNLDLPRIMDNIKEGKIGADELEGAVTDPNTMADLYNTMKQRGAVEKQLNEQIIEQKKEERDAARSQAELDRIKADTERIRSGNASDDDLPAGVDPGYEKFRRKYVTDRVANHFKNPVKDKFGRPVPSKTVEELTEEANAEARAIYYGGTPPPAKPTPAPAPAPTPAPGIPQSGATTSTPTTSPAASTPVSGGGIPQQNPAAKGVIVEKLK